MQAKCRLEKEEEAIVAGVACSDCRSIDWRSANIFQVQFQTTLLMSKKKDELFRRI